MTAEAMKAGKATASHPDMRPGMEQATNKPQPIGQEDADSKRLILHPTDNPATNQALATAAMPELIKRLSTVIDGISGAHLAATRDFKNPQRLAEKINGEAQPAETISDYGACQVSVDSPKAKDEVVAAVRKEFPIVRDKDLFDKGDDDYHFHHVSLQVQMPNHASIELQIVPKEVLDANPDQHKNYKAAREAEIHGDANEQEKQAAEGRAKNDAAMKAFTARNDIGGQNSTTEHKYKFGSTQANLPPDSSAAKSIKSVADSIPTHHLAGDGKDIDAPHVTIRYGIQSEEKKDKLRQFIKAQKPFTAKLGPTAAFPPSEHSDQASPIHAPVHSPELHKLNSEIEKHGDFAPPSFPEYKPHATVAYVKPEHAQRYVDNKATDGKEFKVSSIAISDRDGNHEEIPMLGQSNSETRGGRGESPEQPSAGSSSATSKDVVKPEPLPAITKGSSVVLNDGTAGVVQWSMGGKVRIKTESGGRRDAPAKELTAIPPMAETKGNWVGVDLDGTLAMYQDFKGPTIIGAPIPAMVEEVEWMLADGKDVRIFTARIANDPDGEARKAIQQWCKKNIGRVLPITNVKDHKMTVLYDDRATQVQRNTGKLLGDPKAAADTTPAVDFKSGLRKRA